MTKNELTQEQITCPRCGSMRHQDIGKLVIFLAGSAMFGFGIPLSLIGIGLFMMPIGIGLMLFSPFMKRTLICRDCRKSWKPVIAA